jgi:RsmE family RNA methyltransferase
MHTFYVAPADVHGSTITLRGPEAAAAKRIAKVKRGDLLRAVDGHGNDYRCTANRYAHSTLLCTVNRHLRQTSEPYMSVTLLLPCFKGKAAEQAVQDIVSAGVHQIIPIITTNSDKSITPRIISRLRTHAMSAMKTSGRSSLPDISDPQLMIPACESCVKAQLKLLLRRSPNGQRLIQIIHGYHQRTSTPLKTAVITVEPEQEFTNQEIRDVQALGYIDTHLGARIQRPFTAALTALSILFALEGEF